MDTAGASLLIDLLRSLLLVFLISVDQNTQNTQTDQDNEGITNGKTFQEIPQR
jgi:hypothetical protein